MSTYTCIYTNTHIYKKLNSLQHFFKNGWDNVATRLLRYKIIE